MFNIRKVFPLSSGHTGYLGKTPRPECANENQLVIDIEKIVAEVKTNEGVTT